MNESKTGTSDSYMPQLDALRAFAVASVAYSHWIPEKYHFGLPWGSGGVRLFFVLSGFLITGILLRCREHGDLLFAARAFYARRFLRIFPLFYAVLLIAVILNIRPVRATLPWHMSYLSNFYFFCNQGWDGPISHFWSLAVEEQFYLFWPAVILCLPNRYIGACIVGLIVTGVLSRLFLDQVFPGVKLLNVLPNANFDSLGLGSLLALVAAREFKDSRVRWLIAGVPVYIVLFAIRNLGFALPFHRGCEHLAILLSFTWLVNAASTGFNGLSKTFLELPMLLYLGRISYGVYVLHNFASLPVRFLADIVGFPNLQFGISGIVLMTIFTIGGASLSWHCFETPINKLKQRFPYKIPV